MTIALPAHASVKIIDDAGATHFFATVPKRAISLSPNLTELVFSAGAGKFLQGVVSGSDYPEAARTLPRIGNGHRPDLEAIIKLRPDVVLAWKDGLNPHTQDALQTLRLPVVVFHTNTLASIPHSLQKLGRLFGTEHIASQHAAQFTQQLHKLKPKTTSAQSVFIQIWQQPLMTLNQHTLFADMVRFCGGENIFANLPQPAPTVNIEHVLRLAPEVILTSTTVDFWRQWQHLPAVAQQRVHHIPQDLAHRATLRSLQAVKTICKILHKP